MLLNLLGSNVSFLGRVRYFFGIRNRSLTLRASLITMCLGLTLITTLLLDQSLFLGILPVIGVLGVSAVLFIYYNVEQSLLLVIAVSLLLHDGIGTGTGTKITFTFALLGLIGALWFFKMVMVERKLGIRSSLANLPALLFMIVAIAVFIWSDVFVDPSVRFIFSDKMNPRIMTTISFILAPLTYFMYANNLRSIRSIRVFVWLFIVVGAVFFAMNMVGLTISSPLNYNGQFGAWVTMLALGQAIFNKTYKLYVRFILVIISLGWVYITLGLGITWLSGWLPVLVSIGVLTFLRSRKILVLILIAAAVVLFINEQGIDKTFEAENSESGGTRSAAWSEVFKLTRDHMLFGTGPAGYALYYMVYGFHANLSHNNYVDIIAQTGAVGTVVYLSFWVAVGVMALRTYRNAPRGGFRHALSASLLTANVVTFTSMMLGDWVTPFAYTQGIAGFDYTVWHWMMAGLTIALYHDIRATQVKEPQIIEIKQDNPAKLALSNSN